MIALEKGLKWEKLNLKPEALTWIGAKSMAVDISPTSHPLPWPAVFFMEWKALMYSYFSTFSCMGFFFKFSNCSPFLDHKNCLTNLLLLAL